MHGKSYFDKSSKQIVQSHTLLAIHYTNRHTNTEVPRTCGIVSNSSEDTKSNTTSPHDEKDGKLFPSNRERKAS